MCIQSSRLDLLTHCCDHSFASGHCATPIVALPSTFLHRQIRSRQDVKYYGFDGRSIDFVNFMYANKNSWRSRLSSTQRKQKEKMSCGYSLPHFRESVKPWPSTSRSASHATCISVHIFSAWDDNCSATSFVVKADAHIDVPFLWKVDFLCLVKPFSLSFAFFQPENPVSTNESTPFCVDGSSIAVVRAQVWHNTMSLSSI